MKKGATRWVFFSRNFAYKIPSLYNWKQFLLGLLANMQETQFSKIKIFETKLCPIKVSFPLGFLVVMSKAKILKENELTIEEMKDFCMCNDFIIPAELKYDSFGYINGKLVVVDYGS